jgi:hypothetical protein
VKGYQVWADALKPLLTELLGPSAKEDHAPPPTGDPASLKKKAPENRSAIRDLDLKLTSMRPTIASNPST